MSVKIVIPEHDCEITSTIGTKVFTRDGIEINNITRIVIDIQPNEILSATITVAISELVGFDRVLPQLSRETQEQLRLLGYAKVER